MSRENGSINDAADVLAAQIRCDTESSILQWEKQWYAESRSGRLSVGMARAAASGADPKLAGVWAAVIARAEQAEKHAWATFQREQNAQRSDAEREMRAIAERRGVYR